MFSSKVLISVLVLGAAAAPAFASQVATYTTFASMQAANPLMTFSNISFDAFVGSTFTSFTDSGTGVTFSTPTNQGLGIYVNPGGTWPAGAILKRTTNGGELDITFPTPIRAFGFSLGNAGGAYSLNVIVTYMSGSSYSRTFNPPDSTTPAYFAASFDAPITSFVISTDSNTLVQFDLNNFTVGQQADAPIPETATLVLIGSGLIFLRFLRRRQLQPAV